MYASVGIRIDAIDVVGEAGMQTATGTLDAKGFIPYIGTYYDIRSAMRKCSPS
jgi:hypothetical protein